MADKPDTGVSWAAPNRAPSETPRDTRDGPRRRTGPSLGPRPSRSGRESGAEERRRTQWITDLQPGRFSCGNSSRRGPDRIGPNIGPAGPDHTRPDHTRSDLARPDQVGPDGAGLTRHRSAAAGAGRIGRARARGCPTDQAAGVGARPRPGAEASAARRGGKVLRYPGAGDPTAALRSVRCPSAAGPGRAGTGLCAALAAFYLLQLGGGLLTWYEAEIRLPGQKDVIVGYGLCLILLVPAFVLRGRWRVLPTIAASLAGAAVPLVVAGDMFAMLGIQDVWVGQSLTLHVLFPLAVGGSAVLAQLLGGRIPRR